MLVLPAYDALDVSVPIGLNAKLVAYRIPINCEYALATVGLYEYTLTLDREIRHIWTPKFGWISALFCVNRYLVPLTSALILWKNTSSTSSGSGCTTMVLGQMIVDILMSVCAAIFYAIQAFALFDRQKTLLLFTLALGLATPIITLCVWSTAASESFHANAIGEQCSSLAALVTGKFNGWLVAARVASLASNCLVFALITIKSRMVAKRAGGLSLTSLLIEQGSLYFVAMALPNIVGIGLGKIPIHKLNPDLTFHADVASATVKRRWFWRRRNHSPPTDDNLLEYLKE
ncbi:hypothetical protein BC835DRAFT_1305448 [Cytidiella melzeri]|nr:hypothetical protein BC835DRAFT_1305448 [Cytidiella melzeri]